MINLKAVIPAIIAIIITSPTSYAQSSPELYAFRSNVTKKTGFLNSKHCWVIPPTFSDAGNFSDGRAVVDVEVSKDKNGWGDYKNGFIDTTGQLVIPARFRLGDTNSFSEGLAAVSETGDSWGFIDKSGQWAIPPQFERTYSFSEGLAVVLIGGRYGFIDKAGQWAFPTHFKNAEPFSEGLAAVSTDDKKWGFVDKAGKWVIPPQFPEAYSFSEGLAAVSPEKLKWGFIDKTGKWIIPAQFMRAESFSEGLAAATSDFKTWGYIDKTGMWVIPAQFEEGAPPLSYSEGLAVAAVREKPDAQNENGQWVMGLRYGYIDKAGKWVIPVQFDYAYQFQNGFAQASYQHTTYHTIDKTGNIVLEPTCTEQK